MERRVQKGCCSLKRDRVVWIRRLPPAGRGRDITEESSNYSRVHLPGRVLGLSNRPRSPLGTLVGLIRKLRFYHNTILDVVSLDNYWTWSKYVETDIFAQGKYPPSSNS